MDLGLNRRGAGRSPQPAGAPPACAPPACTGRKSRSALLAELRQCQQTPAGRAKLRERVKVDHALAHVGHWQGLRARYRGARKNLFDLRRVAMIHNLPVIARQVSTGDYQLAA